MMRENDLDGVILSSGELAHDVCVCVYVRTASRSLYGSFLCVRCCYIVLPLICRSATLEHSRSESTPVSDCNSRRARVAIGGIPVVRIEEV